MKELSFASMLTNTEYGPVASSEQSQVNNTQQEKGNEFFQKSE